MKDDANFLNWLLTTHGEEFRKYYTEYVKAGKPKVE